MGLEKSIHIADLESAPYFVVVQGAEGQITKRFIKE